MRITYELLELIMKLYFLRPKRNKLCMIIKDYITNYKY